MIERILLGYSARETLKVLIDYFTCYRHYKAMPDLQRGFSEHKPSHLKLQEIKRITDAYLKAKEQQVRQPQPYQVGEHWQNTINLHMKPLVEALNKRDYPTLQKLFSNQQRTSWGQSWGGYVDLANLKTKPFFKYEFINTWHSHHNELLNTFGDIKLSYPLAGNPVGIHHKGSIVPIEAIRDAYNAEQMRLLLDGIETPIVCEIGGGQGGQAYALLKCGMHYIGLDIPEILVLASYFLLASMPSSSSILLYGEGAIGDYDIILLPNFCLKDLGVNSVDLVFNQFSFPEMDTIIVQEYLKQISRICKYYFYHINGERPPRDPYGLEYVKLDEIIPDKSFKLLSKCPYKFVRLNNATQVFSLSFIYCR